MVWGVHGGLGTPAGAWEGGAAVPCGGQEGAGGGRAGSGGGKGGERGEDTSTAAGLHAGARGGFGAARQMLP